MRNKLYIILIIFLFAGLSFTGCSVEKTIFDNSRIYGDVYINRTWMRDDFYEDNLTASIYLDCSLPETRTVEIKNETDFKNTFREFPQLIDFEKSLIVMHGFTTASSSSYDLKTIFLNNNVLSITYMQISDNKKSQPNASIPETKWIIIVIPKINYETIEFKLN